MAVLPALPAAAGEMNPTLGFYGMPGLYDTPTARSLADADLAIGFAGAGPTARGTLAFQITPRLTGSLRYSRVEGLDPPRPALYDRSLDLHFRFLDETDWLPAMAVGLRDLAGTGTFASEYIVATKALGPRLDVSAGIGWGRLATRGAFDNPLGVFGSYFDTRPPFTGPGGEPGFEQWFRGPAALFGGIEFRPTDRLTLKAEYSSDAYLEEVSAGVLEVDSALNFGLEYQWRPGATVGLHYLYGTEVGISASFVFNPRTPPMGDLSPAGVPVGVRAGSVSEWDGAWTAAPGQVEVYRATLAKALEIDGMGLEYLELSATTARVGLRNARYDAEPQALGRTARMLTQLLPPSVETFVLEPVVEGSAASRVTLRRSDIERYEHAADGAALMLARTEIDEAGARPGPEARPDDLYPDLSFGLGPYLATSFFDPEAPIRADVGLEATARLDIAPGLSASGAVRLKLAGDLDESMRVSDSVLPHVRSDANIYDREGENGIQYLTLDYLFRPGENLYGRVSAGYLEPMFGGVSGELLWKPVDSRLGLGAEVNYARQRDFDKLFGFQDYDVVTGHVSAYYELGGGFEAQVDVGRYLAGDWGATFALDRTFANGWRIGAFATFTDVSAEEFGEGSFDKGIRITAPLSWFTGRPSRTEIGATIRPVQRDGGQRLDVRNRLYPLVRDYHESDLSEEWGRFFR
ncbi:MAG: YjbH domain-containing protein [Paracoccaceae bacterium]|nr:YjbH domain-containing protein [Paracoccaceae bacterium]